MRPALALLLLLASAPVLAQDPAASSSESKDKETKKKKVIRLDAITVEGRIQKPQAFYVLPRGNLNFDELNKSESFVPKVVKSVEKEPF
ncbi:hypothetical protein JRI60_38685 [Archangium violaceum]|jgi:hypothetical protein|uniref:hypothetical protein n=1 Tax=Archangium violaceum TaxID=83451 RepID=UPI0019519944|nr:hypothetical protein [Archangium violaceum]QRN94978.1 hypothetical protein JRI60_38685 [Archangium violaceum]